MDIRTGTEIDVPLSTSWPLLHDVTLVVSCLPGAGLTGDRDEDGEYPGQLEVRFGPTRASFAGRASLEYDDQDKTVAIRARGQDARGRTRAVVDVTVRADQPREGVTGLHVGGTIDVVGALERFAATGGAVVAEEMMRSFAANLGSHLLDREARSTAPDPDTVATTDGAAGARPRTADTRGPAPAATTPTPIAPAPLRVGALLWGIVRRWFRRS